MDKRKIIGTLIGVLMFGLLIAGATFAWFTFSITIDSNSTTNAGSMNFSVNYTKGADLTTLPILSSATPSNTEIISIVANKVSGSADGTLYIYLNTNSDNSTSDLITSGAIKYGYCIGTCSTFTGTGSLTSTSQKLLYSGALQATATTYNFYFWLDGALVDNDLLGSNYSGYISAEAKQVGAQ